MPLSQGEQDFLKQVEEYLNWLVSEGVITEAQKLEQMNLVDQQLASIEGQADTKGAPLSYTSLPIFSQVQSFKKQQSTWAKQQAEQKSADEKPTAMVFSAPGQPPRLAIVAAKDVATLRTNNQYLKEAAEYQAQIDEQNQKTEEWNKYYGLQPAMQQPGQDQTFTSAASIAENQRMQPAIARGWDAYNQQADAQARRDYELSLNPNTVANMGRRQALEKQARIEAGFNPLPMDAQNKIVGLQLSKMGEGQTNQNYREFINANAPKIASEFDILHPGAREAWWGALHTIGGNVDSTKAQLAYGRMGMEGKSTAEVTRDPLLVKAEQYPWYKEFMDLSARERGYTPKRFAPTANWM